MQYKVTALEGFLATLRTWGEPGSALFESLRAQTPINSEIFMYGTMPDGIVKLFVNDFWIAGSVWTPAKNWQLYFTEVVDFTKGNEAEALRVRLQLSNQCVFESCTVNGISDTELGVVVNPMKFIFHDVGGDPYNLSTLLRGEGYINPKPDADIVADFQMDAAIWLSEIDMDDKVTMHKVTVMDNLTRDINVWHRLVTPTCEEVTADETLDTFRKTFPETFAILKMEISTFKVTETVEWIRNYYPEGA